MTADADHAAAGGRQPPFSLTPGGVLVALLVSVAAVELGAWIAPGVRLEATSAAFLVVLVVSVLNAVLAPVVAALRLPYTFALGFLLVLLLDAAMLVAAAAIF